MFAVVGLVAVLVAGAVVVTSETDHFSISDRSPMEAAQPAVHYQPANPAPKENGE